MQPHLYHTYPLVCLKEIPSFTPLFVEAHPCMDQITYKSGVMSNEFKMILDCGVGASPDLSKPTSHIKTDPSFGIKYLSLMMDLQPNVLVIPDVLGDAAATFDNYYHYTSVLSNLLDALVPELMYVIQGQTPEEAAEELKRACSFGNINWIGIPRIVHYFKATSTQDRAEERINFITPLLDRVKKKNKKLHLLGVNNVQELKWVAKQGISTDSRLATLAAINNFDVTQQRPDHTINADLCAEHSYEIKDRILKGMKVLDNIFYGNT